MHRFGREHDIENELLEELETFINNKKWSARNAERINLKRNNMSYGTDFKADIFLNRQTYMNKYNVEDAIKECESSLSSMETRIKMFAISNPKDITPEGEEVVFWINSEVDSAIELLLEETVKHYQLTLYLEYLEDQ